MLYSLGAGAIIWFDWTWVDPVITLLIASYVLWQVFKMFPQATRVLMEGTPVDFDLNQLVKIVEQIDGVSGTHHVHVWELDEQHRALEAHVVLRKGSPDELESIKRHIKQSLSAEFHIQHSTLEFEYAGVGEGCDDQQVIADH